MENERLQGELDRTKKVKMINFADYELLTEELKVPFARHVIFL